MGVFCPKEDCPIVSEIIMAKMFFIIVGNVVV
jgi:hypothetical protein